MNNKSKNINHIDYGKIPPQAIDVEEKVIGAVILEKDAILMVDTFLKPEMFYKDAHQKIYNAVIELQLKTAPIDLLTVTEHLRKFNLLDSVGGPFYITKLTSGISSAANTEYHARIIEQKYLQRELIRLSTEYQGKSYDDSLDVKEIIDQFAIDIMKITSGVSNQVQSIAKSVDKSLDHLEQLIAKKINPYGILTRLRGFDKPTNGIQKGVTVLAGRPGMGKTSLVLQMINNIAVDQNIPVALFELEMFEQQLIRWMQTQRTGIDNKRLKKGQIYPEEIQPLDNESSKLMQAPLYVDYTAGINIMQLRSKAIQLKHLHNIQLIVIDYLQLMGNVDKSKGNQNREQEVAQISSGIRALSKELDIPIIALAQLNRTSLGRSDKRPQLSDLRESGAIEQDADIVAFIHRPEKYGFIEDEEGNSLKGVAEIIFAKNRDGDNDIEQIQFTGNTLSFTDFAEELPNPDEFTQPQIKNEAPF